MSEWKNVSWSHLSALSRRIGQRYGFACVSLANNTDVALLGGAVHFEAAGASAQSKTDIEKGNPVPFSQVHCIGPVTGGDESSSPFDCDLMSIKPASDLPCPRLYHSASLIEIASKPTILVFGGQAFTDKRKLSDIWCLTLTDSSLEDHGVRHGGSWRELAPASRSSSFPPPRSQHAVSVVPGSDMLIVSGGSGFEQTVLGDMWVATIGDQGTNVLWKRVNSPMGKVPSARRSHALSPLVSDIEVLLLGGIDGNGNVLSDLWIAQFTNDEKTRCVWTELVACPNLRYSHLVTVSDSSLVVFGGSKTSADKYDLKTGTWSSATSIQESPTLYRAMELDVIYKSGGSEFPVQSVLMIGDTVDRQAPISPYVASIFASNVEEDQVQKVKDEDVVMDEKKDFKGMLDNSIDERRNAYRRLVNFLPCIPPGDSAAGGAVAILATPPIDGVVSIVPQFTLHSVEYFFQSLFGGDDGLRSTSSWSGGSQTTCHILGTCSESSVNFNRLTDLETFINDPRTFRAVTESANSCVVVLKNGDEKLIGFISEALERHSQSHGQFPVLSTRTTPYSEIQATLRLMMIYTPFRTADALTELFDMLSFGSGGFLLVDFDGESELKSPIPSHFKPTTVKDATAFWYEALRSLTRPRPRIDQFALTYLHSTNFAINGQIPSTSLSTILKTKILNSPTEKTINSIGSVLIGTMKNGPNIGVLLYSNGCLVRHMSGRFALTGDHDIDQSDPLQASVMQVSAFVDVKHLTVADGPLSDFSEAIASSPEWTKFKSKIEELCLVYLQKGSI